MNQPTMNDNSPSAPPTSLYSGTLGDELVVLSIPEVRIAERAIKPETLVTADGPVGCSPGDFIVSMLNGERFPIKPEIYFGTYEILSQVGAWYVGRRLLHPRRAWPITSPGAELEYGPGRGRVFATRGGWVYQSDDHDFGLINSDAKKVSYTLVGAAAEMRRCAWAKRFRSASLTLALLPTILTGLALAALHVSVSHPYLALALLVLEAAGLIGGASAAWLIHRHRWALRAATTAGLDTARQFQVAVEALGRTPSQAFPTMALWRAAQDDRPLDPAFDPARLRALKALIDDTFGRTAAELERDRLAERRAGQFTWTAAIIVLVCLVTVATTHLQLFKLAAIWLPSMVGVAHALTWRRQVVRRAEANTEMLSELKFVRSKLVTLAPADAVSDKPEQRAECIAVVRMLCKTVAQHTQREMQFTVSEHVGVPV